MAYNDDNMEEMAKNIIESRFGAGVHILLIEGTHDELMVSCGIDGIGVYKIVIEDGVILACKDIEEDFNKKESDTDEFDFDQCGCDEEDDIFDCHCYDETEDVEKYDGLFQY